MKRTSEGGEQYNSLAGGMRVASVRPVSESRMTKPSMVRRRTSRGLDIAGRDS